MLKKKEKQNPAQVVKRITLIFFYVVFDLFDCLRLKQRVLGKLTCDSSLFKALSPFDLTECLCIQYRNVK